MKRVLLLLPLVAALIYGGYWLWGARQLEAGAVRLIEERAAAGWVSEAEEVSTGGFPLRFETTLTQPRFGQRDGPIIWESAQLTVAQQSLDPQDFTLHFAPEQRLILPGGQSVLRLEEASARLRVDRQERLDVLEIETQSGSLDTPDLGAAALGPGRVFVTKGETPNSYDITLALADLVIPPALLGAAQEMLTNRVDTLTANARMQFTGPWDAAALAGAQPGLVAIDIESAELNADGATLSVSGRLTPDAAGYASGTLTLRAANFDMALERAQAGGAFSGLRGQIALSFLRALAGEDGAVQQSLDMSDGVIRLGPITLGRAPLLVR